MVDYSPSQKVLHAFLTAEGVQVSKLVDRFYGSRKPANPKKSVTAILHSLRSRADRNGDTFCVHTTGRRGQMEAAWRVSSR